MLPEIISCNKSMQLRLQEYEQLLEDVDTPCSEINEVWSSIFTDLSVIGVDWHALWILSEENCRKYGLVYPTAVIVNVNSFCWDELLAQVSVLAVQEDIVIPSAVVVPVIELHPIKVQDYDITDLRDIEDWLDMCRFFFTKLWYPWDAKISVSVTEWCENHLRDRLKMQYDLKNGIFQKSISTYIKSLLAEAQSLSAFSEVKHVEEDVRLSVVKKYIRRKILKTELELFEEPDLRYGMILLKKKERSLRSQKDVKFVWLNGSCDLLMEYLKQIQEEFEENVKIKVCGSLQEALDGCCNGDTVILPPGVHVMTMLRGIENGGKIKGLNKLESLIVPDTSAMARAILMECFGPVQLENLSISKHSGILIQIFDDTVKISKCRISSKSNSTSRGVVVGSGCKLILEGCELNGLGTAIVLQRGAEAAVKDTKIVNCYEGIKVSEGSSLTLNNVDILFSSSFDIRVETKEIDDELPIIGGVNLFQKTKMGCIIEMNAVNFSGKKDGNVYITKLEEVFDVETSSEKDPESDAIYISDQEEFDDSFDDDVKNGS